MIHKVFAPSLPTTTSSITCSTSKDLASSRHSLISAFPAPSPRAFGDTYTEPILALCSCFTYGFVSSVATPINFPSLNAPSV